MKYWVNGVVNDTILGTTASARTKPVATTMETVGGRGDAGPFYVVSAKVFSTATKLTLVDAKKKASDSADPVETVYKISLGNVNAKDDAVDVAPGAYLVQYVTNLAAKQDDNGKYAVAGILTADEDQAWKSEDVQNFADMPAAHWIVTEDTYAKKVTIVNRETGAVLKDVSENEINGVYVYKAGADDQICVFGGDTLNLTKLSGDAVTAQNVGYLGGNAKEQAEKKFALNYFNAINDTKFVDMAADSTLCVNAEDGLIYFALDSAGMTSLHSDVKDEAGKVIVKGIKRNYYNLYVANKNVENAEKLYVFATTDGKGYRLSKKNTTYTTPAKFYIAEYNSKAASLKAEAAATKYFALIEATDAKYKVGVKDNTLALSREAFSEVRTSAFALVEEPAPLYRRLGATIEDGIAKNDTAYVELFMANEPTRFLYENSQNRVAENGTGVAADSLNFLGVYNKADLTRNASIFVDTAYVRNDTVKPLYMLAMAAEYTPAGEKTVVCPIHGADCEHATKYTTRENIAGRYLVALGDSTDNKSAFYQGNARLAFVPAVHMGDDLIIISSGDTLNLSEGTMNAATFAFRLVDDEAEADFYIEANKGQYVRVHNGVPVLVNELSEAATFNIKKSEVVPTANEAIEAASVKVIAGEGFVTIKGAAGKKVVIANVLGQTVANTIASSDEAQIAAPAGVVIVAVEGEAAVKAIVK